MNAQQKTFVVTGGASGIGQATVLLLARSGAKVVIGDIDAAGAAKTISAAGEGGQVRFHPLDLTQPSTITSFAEVVLKENSVVTGVVNGAGWDQVEPFMDNTPELWDKLIAINLSGAIRVSRAFLPRMIESGGGKIVNISSDAGRVGSMGETVYSATKGGIISFTKALAREMARYQINVNCVCPGPTDTPLLHSQTSAWAQRIKDGMLRAIPFRRLGKPEEIADAIEFFLSERSAFVTGQVLSVSGGLTMVD